MAENTYISLFSGYGGLDLAVRRALPEARCVCYVERETPAAAILASRMEDGGLEDAPIWSDIVTFPSRLFRGRVAGLVGGFPCQDLSVAGRQAGIEGERSGLFFEIVRLVRELESVEWLFLENVPPVLNFPAGTTVLGELAALGFDAEWGTLRASDVGGSHRRERAFVLAYRTGRGLGKLRESSGGGGFINGGADDAQADTPHDHGRRGISGAETGTGQDGERWIGPAIGSRQLANTNHPRLEIRRGERGNDEQERKAVIGNRLPLFPPGPADLNAWRQVPEWLHPAVEPGLRRLADGANTRMDRLRAAGNGVVPLQGAVALALLLGRAR